MLVKVRLTAPYQFLVKSVSILGSKLIIVSVFGTKGEPMAKLGSVVEFYNEYYKANIFGKISSFYIDMQGQIKEYWVEHIDNGSFEPKHLVRIVEEGDKTFFIPPSPRFRVGDKVKYNDGERTWALVIKDAECLIDENTCQWSYFFEENDVLGNKITWDEPSAESGISLL